MARWTTRLALWPIWALAEGWLMARRRRARHRTRRPLDAAALSPHLLRDVGLLDDADRAHTLVGRERHLG